MKIFSGKDIIMPPVQMFWLRPQPDHSYKLWLMNVIRFLPNDLWFLTRNRALQLRSFFELKACFFPPMLAMIEYEGWLYPLHKLLLPRFDVHVLEKLYVNLPESRIHEIEAKKTRQEQEQRAFLEQQILHRIHQCQGEIQHQQAFTRKVQDALGIELPLGASRTQTQAHLEPQSQPQPLQCSALAEEPYVYCGNCNTVYIIPADYEDLVCDYCGSLIYCQEPKAQLPSPEYGTFMRDKTLELPNTITSPIAIGTWHPKILTNPSG